MATTQRTFFVRLVLDTTDDLQAVADGLEETLTDAGYDVAGVDTRDDIDTPEPPFSTDILG